MSHAGLAVNEPRAADHPEVRGAPAPVGTVAVVGLGYVGLPTALALADAGRDVVGIDVSPDRLRAIRAGDVDVVPADAERLARLRGSDRLTLESGVAAAGAADAIVICVPTPVDEHLGPDLTCLRDACAAVVEVARPGQTIVLTSTTYVGSTHDLLTVPLAARGLHAGTDVHIAFSPERIDPANTTFGQDRVPRVVGGVTDRCTDAAALVVGAVAPLVHRVSSPEAAELTKLLENTFRAVNIALANEFADIGGALGLDIVEVIDAAATKPYGYMPFYPGPGVGGHCIPCDPHYLLWQLRAERVQAPVIGQAMSAIAQRPHRVVERALEVLSERGQGLAGAKVLVVGVAYKPGVADVRESPALEIIDALDGHGATVAYWDRLVPEVRLPGGRTVAGLDDPEGFDPDLVVVHTAHPDADLGWLAAHPCVLDATFRLTLCPDRAVP